MLMRQGGTVVVLDVAYLERLIPDIHLVGILFFNGKTIFENWIDIIA